MDFINDNVLLKYLNGDIESSAKNNILVLNDEIIKVCKGKTLLNKNEMTLIVGGKGSGKSKFMNHLIKQILMNETDVEFNIVNQEDFKVICFDSEMSESRLVEWSIKNVYNEFGDEYVNDILKDKLFLYSLVKEKFNNRTDEIVKIYNQLQLKYPKSHFIICIDVGSCLTNDLNSNLNAGYIDLLKAQLNTCTLIMTIHNSLKDEDQLGVPAGSIGTALEKLAFIMIAIKKPDQLNRHKVIFFNSKSNVTTSENDYFYFHIETVNEITKITGLSDSDGILIKEKKRNIKVEPDEFKSILFELLSNTKTIEDRLQKNIVQILKVKFDYQNSSVYEKIKILRDQGLINLNKDGELFIN
jgi:hypothetical protein